MTEPWSSGLYGAALSLAIFAVEVLIIWRLKKLNTRVATEVSLAVFVVAFGFRLVLLLMPSTLGAHDARAFGSGVALAFVLGVVIHGAFWATYKG